MFLLDQNDEILDPFQEFVLQHQPQLESSNIPVLFWETLHDKLTNEIFDAGNVFQLALYEDQDDPSQKSTKKLIVSSPDGISCTDERHIYLVDHAWTYEANRAKQHLQELPQLLTRMATLMGWEAEETEDNKADRIDFVLREMWKYNNTFSFNVGEVENRLPLWYVMDEVGCAISHSDSPNFRSVPFIHLPQGTYYSIIFPIRDLEHLEEVTRDFVENLTKDPEVRRALLLPWVPSDFDNTKFDQEEPDDSYFLQGRVQESLPEPGKVEPLSTKDKIKVFSQYEFVEQYLKDPRFEVTQDKTQADIIWLVTHFKEYRELSIEAPGVYVNQFPHENVLTVKDLLSITCRRTQGTRKHDPDTLETFPSWFPSTFNLSTELVQFVAYFRQREKKGLDNHWIVKPWNLARGLDMHITDNLFHILRLPSTGPKIVQKYLENPVLYHRPEIGPVKFDVRYVVLLRSTKPLRACAYTNFFLRFANKKFGLDNLDDYEQHFTVMNYDENVELCHLKCADFIREWDRQYPNFEWRNRVEPKILEMLKEMFEAAVALSPPKGIAESPQSRALYAVDLMLEWKNDDVQPKLLEVNFSPDCQRACEYYPDFYNDVFNWLFLDRNESGVFHDLC